MRNESIGEDLSSLRCQPVLFAVSASPGCFFCERFEVEHSRYDPKDGELYLRIDVDPL